MYGESEVTELITETFGEATTAMLGGGGEFGAEYCDRAGDRGEDGVEIERLSEVSEATERIF